MSKTYVQKGHMGWNAETIIDLEGNKRLSITTMKRSNGRLQSIASVGKVEGHFISHMVYQDFLKVVANTAPSKVTEKAVVSQHNDVIAPTSIQQIMEMVKAHYPNETVEAIPA